jgi:hypothetical protein
MSNEARDELALTIMHHPWIAAAWPKGYCPTCDRVIDAGHNSPCHADHVADAILTAGYRKPRTIATVEELNALPVGSVVLRNGRAFQRFAPTPAAFDEYQMWRCPDGGFVRSTKDGSSILPATVVHEAEAS